MSTFSVLNPKWQKRTKYILLAFMIWTFMYSYQSLKKLDFKKPKVISESLDAIDTINPMYVVDKPLKVLIYNRVSGFFPNNPFQGCEDKCIEAKKADYKTTRHIMFLGSRLHLKPPKKLPNQVWILFGRESPPHHSDVKKWKNLFNFTASFRRDADLYIGYTFLKTIVANDSKQHANYSESNPKFSVPPKAGWIVSNCVTTSKRSEFAELMTKKNKFFIDIYGACGKKKCAHSINSQCLSSLASSYPFYISFENSLCVDYISEKPFVMLFERFDSIPIVRGEKYSYQHMLPPKSYINVHEYPNISSLIDKLIQIVQSKSEFLSYFQWRKHYELKLLPHFCNLCKQLHIKEQYKVNGIYENIDNWLNGSDKRPMCHPVNDLIY